MVSQKYLRTLYESVKKQTEIKKIKCQSIQCGMIFSKSLRHCLWRTESTYFSCETYFWNSLLIHQVKTKKITTEKEVWIPGLNYHRFWRFYFSVYSLVFVSIEKIYQTLETVFHLLSKHLEFHQEYSAVRRIFNSLLGVWISRWNTVSRVWYHYDYV